MRKKCMIFSLAILTVVLCFASGMVYAAELTKVLELHMDGTIIGTDYNEPNGNPVVSTVLFDEYGNPPDINGGVMYTNGKSSNGLAIDEGLSVPVSTGYNIETNYIFEIILKPDYANFPTASDNTWGVVRVLSWWEIYDWYDIPGTKTPHAGFTFRTNGYWIDSDVTEGEGYQVLVRTKGDVDPNLMLPADKFSHLGMVYTYNTVTNLGRLYAYIDGELVGSDVGTLLGTCLDFPDHVGVGNVAYTQLANGGDVNFNSGFSGWVDAVAISTFTGVFEGPWEFALADPQECGDMGTIYKPGDINEDCVVNLKDFAKLASDWLSSGL